MIAMAMHDARIKADTVDRQLVRVGADASAMLERGQEGEGCPPREEV
jgi:hypothetical protein